MTDKLICPFCDSELCGNSFMPYCPSVKCKMGHRPINFDIWKQLIALQKKLDKALEIINNTRDIFYGCGAAGTAGVIEQAIKEIEDIKA